MDTLELAVLAVSASNLALLVLLLLGIRSFSRVFSNIPALLRQLVDGFLWQDEEIEQEDGTKAIKRTLSPQIVAAVQTAIPAVAPVLMKEAMEWAKKNVKLNLPSMMGGGEGGGESGMIGMLLSQVPKKYQGIASIALPLLKNFLPGLGGGSTAAAGTSGGPVAKVR